MLRSLALDRRFFKTLITLSLPVAFQNLINTMLNAIDSVMIGSLGSSEIAAVGFANQIFLVLATMLFGVCTGCGIFISQFYGKGDYENIKKSVALNVAMAVFVSTVFTFLALLRPEMLMRLFTNDENVIALGCSYIRVIAISYIPTAVSVSFAFALRAVGKQNVPLIVTVLCLFVNAGCNYIFIFGKFGAPKLGVAGAALGTVIARAAELIMLLGFSYLKTDILRVKIRHCTSISRSFLIKFLKTILPVIGNETMWSVGTAAYSAVFGRLSTDAAAAINITKVLENMMLVFFQGLGNGAGIMIGRRLGENKYSDATRYANTFTVFVPCLGIAFIALMLLIRPVFLSLYNVEPSIIDTTSRLILIAALFIPFRAINYVQIVGTLRSGGDTLACLIIDAGGIWLVSLPLTFITGILLHMDVEIVYACSMIEEFLKAFIVIWRIHTKRWMKNLVHDM